MISWSWSIASVNEAYPLSVGVLDMDWHIVEDPGSRGWRDRLDRLHMNEKLFPDPPAFLAELHKRGLKNVLNDILPAASRDTKSPIRDGSEIETRHIDGRSYPFDITDSAFLMPI